MTDLDTELRHLLATPSLARQILTVVASALRSEDPVEPLTLDAVNDFLRGAALVLTDQMPTVIADEAIQRAARALPSIYSGETADAYALRVLQIARSA
ncbi:hypothetical protein [Streptomyces fulvorobeus]|uniref:Uncharacterized protein n=1 Tax=Streptomyces fulvorobeus TaxID=284028 RepID=A0A7J0C3C1_9ACTN|nr:hypothetical protein [Streptomyces fulvorobeus]NYE40713.1 hypothetical protein [Streptomyces fulvorobeus]GFM97015.1 hypothetical protein Sfulv_18260 [Streptomyces fulvorobeus]